MTEAQYRRFKFNHWPLTGFLLVFVGLAIIFSLAIPLDEVPDEEEHFVLIRFIAEQKRPPP